jgi:hypothetical protein
MHKSETGGITDKFLIQWFKNQFQDISFVKHSKEHNIRHIDENGIPKLTSEIIEELELKPFDQQLKKAMYLWEMLLKDALIFLKWNDVGERVHDKETFGIDKLRKYYDKLEKFEDILYGGVKYYRDHTVHPIRVFLVGEYLIKSRIEFKNLKILEEGVRGFEQIEISTEEKEAMWSIISLTHDLGYPLEKMDAINRKVRQMMEEFGKVDINDFSVTFPPQGQFISDFILRFISSKLVIGSDDSKSEKIFKTHVQSKYWLKLSRAFEEYNHGLVSCTLLMKYLVYFLESDYLIDENKLLKERDAKQFIIRREILRAIASHHCEDIYHLTSNNFSFMLILCDELQVWHRLARGEESNWKIDKIDLSIKNVHFRVSVNKEPEDFKQIFCKRCRKYTKIFRSGVDAELRIKEGFNFKFEMINTYNKDHYEFHHYIPSDSELLNKYPIYLVQIFLNGEPMEYEEFCSKKD